MTQQKIGLGVIMSIMLLLYVSACGNSNAHKPAVATPVKKVTAVTPVSQNDSAENEGKLLDTTRFNFLQSYLVHNIPTAKWPVKADYPLPGAILPFKRIIAYYGNFYSKGMGILGELSYDEMLKKLQEEAEVWRVADTLIPVLPAIQYIAVTAQRSPGKGNKYRARMPFQQIDTALKLARKINGILIIDVQVGHSTLQEELPVLEQYLCLPDVHLAIDPEYSMKDGQVPCTAIGTFDAADINYAAEYLTSLVAKYKLNPKILVVHRFTKEMVTNYKDIILHREVQMVIDMDGFGFKAKKVNSYKVAVVNEPIQFAGFKLFYKNDKLTKPYKLMTPAEVLQLNPAPIYIQYQ